MKYAACLVLLFVAVACSPGKLPLPPVTLPNPIQLLQATPQPTAPAVPRVTPTPTPPKVKLLAYGYKSKDVGDGWVEGVVRLAFENIFDGYIEGGEIDLSQAVVQTQEGKTYPVSLYQAQPYQPQYQAQVIDFSRIDKYIPPHYRWTRIGVSGDTIKYDAKVGTYDLGIGEYYLWFRVATAAHPTSIVFAKYPDWDIELASAAQPTLALPADAANLKANSLSALAGKVLIDTATGIKVTLDGTGAFSTSGQDVQLRYTIVNKDKLDSHGAAVELPVRAFFFGDGAVELATNDIKIRSLEAGPGQTKQAMWSLGKLFFDKKCNAKLYALIQDADQLQVYNLNVCK